MGAVKPFQSTLARASAVLSLVLACHAAAAQETPGTVGETLKPPPELKQPAPPPVVQPPPPAPPPNAAATRITVQRFDFTGNTLYDSATLSGLIAAYLNHPVTLLDLYAAADKVTAFYIRHGYTLASVTIPAQRVSGGVVRLQVFEGRIGKVAVEGNRFYSSAHIGKYLQPLRPGEVYRGDTLETGMLRLNALPGLSAKAVVRPGEQFGTSDIAVKAEEKRWAGSAVMDNYGRQNIGATRYSASLTVNDPFGVEDQISLTGLTSEAGLLTYGYAQYSRALDFTGLRATLSYGHAQFEVGGPFAGVEGHNYIGRATFDKPLVQTRTDTLGLSFGASTTDANTDLQGLPLSGTSLRLGELGGFFNHVYPDLAVTQATAGLSTNFHKTTQHELAQPDRKDDQRLRLELDVQHLQPLIGRLQGLVRVNGAYSPDPLVDTQQFSLGGPYSVRGYPASEVRGDRGLLSQIALQYPFNPGPVSVLGRVYFDSGIVFHENPPPGTRKHESLASPGLGADVRFLRYFNLRLDVAFPISDKRASDGRNDVRLFGAFSAGF